MFPYHVIYRGVYLSHIKYIEGEQLRMAILIFYLSLLALLNYYWLYRFFEMLFNWKAKGVPQDLQNDPGKNS